jgi:glutamine amidotransferase
MSRVLALIGNRPSLCAVVARNYAPLLRVQTHGKARGWGIGFYQSGEALLRRRPLDDREVIEIAALNDVSTGLLLAQVRTPGVGSLRTENTPPFRYRNWLFAQRGSIEGFESVRSRLIEALPEFLRCNLRGETDSEVMFYSLLSCLNEGAAMEAERLAIEPTKVALKLCLSRLDALLEEVGCPAPSLDWFFTDGEHLLSLHRTDGAAYRTLSSLEGLDEQLPEGPPGAPLSPFSCTVLASGLDQAPDGWQWIERGSVVVMSRTDAPSIERL